MNFYIILFPKNLEMLCISDSVKTRQSLVALGSALIAILLTQSQIAMGQQESDDNSSVGSWTHIVKYDSNGDFLGRWGTDGTGDGELVHPHGIAIDSTDNVYVNDEERQDVQKFDSNGTFISKLGSEGSGTGQFSNLLEDVAVDGSDNVFVV